ncbi:MAG TPA: hypothetical protein VNZ63_12400, partial [Verrucomicrobiae bacterium]|nr:hypothetical protein [Verrucomicrobiae bacterium]
EVGSSSAGGVKNVGTKRSARFQDVPVVRNLLIVFFRAAVSLNGKPANDSERKESREERDIRLVFQSQGYSLAFW